MKKFFWFPVVLAMVFSDTSPLLADTSSDVVSMLESMKQQMAKMQDTLDRQNLRLQQLESSKVLEGAAPSVPIQPSAVQTMSDADWQKGIQDNLGEAIPWLKGAKYGGDFRLRYEAFEYYDKQNDAGSTGTAADRTRNRFRLRLRWGFEKDYGDDWKVGFRLATGNTTDNTSTNQTLGNSGYFTFKNILVDRAYAVYTPAALKEKGIFKELKVGAGKLENPFFRYSTPIVWDADVTPEGAYEQANLKLVSTEDTHVNFQATAGQFITNENTAVESDAGLYGYQGALNVSTHRLGTEQPIDFTAAVSYYDYTNWFQTVASNSAGVSFLRTNTLLADDFRVLDIYPEVQFYIHRIPTTLWYDYAVNLANVGTDDFAQSAGNDIHDQDQAWGVGAKIGKLKKKGDFEFFYGYYEIGVNSVVAAFNESDFGGPGQNGFTNRKGHKFGLGYQLTDNIAINWTGYLVRPLSPSTVVANSTHEDVFRSQADVAYKF